MWARIAEWVLGTWLILSHFLFSTQNTSDLVAAFFILLLATLSFFNKLNKMHLLEVFPAGWLFYIGYSFPTPWLPFSMQNYILTALSILMFSVIPSNASDHPRPWKRFFKPYELK